MVPVKAERVPLPDIGESESFWRGMVDGDGSLGISNGYATIALFGQRAVLEPFAVFMRERCGAKVNVIIHHHADVTKNRKTLWKVETSGATALAAIRLLYSGVNDEVALTRKLLHANDLMLTAR